MQSSNSGHENASFVGYNRIEELKLGDVIQVSLDYDQRRIATARFTVIGMMF